MLNQSGSTFTTPTLIADAYQPDLGPVAYDNNGDPIPNGSVDSIPSFTMVNGFPASSCLELQSTQGGFLWPRMTTVERDLLNAASGMTVYNTTTSTYDLYISPDWISVSGSDVVGPGVSVVNDVVVFNNTTGNLLADSGVQLIYSAGNSNLFQGVASGNVASTSNFNISYGISLLEGVLTGGNNIVFGTNILNILESGGENVCVGDSIITESLTATRNTVVGFACMQPLTDPTDMFDNVAVGYRVLQDVSGATTTVAIGSSVGLAATSTGDCVFIGFNVASDFAGAFTSLTAVGAYALQDVNTTAARVTALGWSSLQSLTTASRCTAAGYLSLPLITVSATGSDASAFGANAFEACTTALQSSAFGSGAGSTQTQYTGCLFLGYEADASNNNLTNATAIGAGSSVAVSNAMVLGAAGTHVGINTSSPTAAHLTNAGSEAVNAVSVINASFPYVALGTDSVILCYPTGPQTVTIPDASAANYGRKFVVVNRSGDGLDRITVSTTTNQPIQSSNVLNFQSSKTFIAVPAANDGVTNAPGYVCINESQGV